MFVVPSASVVRLMRAALFPTVPLKLVRPAVLTSSVNAPFKVLFRIGTGESGVGSQLNIIVVSLIACGIDSTAVDIRGSRGVGGQAHQGSAIADGAVEVGQSGGVDVECDGSVEGFVKGDVTCVCAGESGAGSQLNIIVVSLIARGIDSTAVDIRGSRGVGGQAHQGSAIADGAVEVGQACSVDVECERTI